MPRNQPLDWELISKTIDASPSLKAAAETLGLHYNTVWKVAKYREGTCHRCHKAQPVPDSKHCAACQEYMRTHQSKRRRAKIAKRLCILCNVPIDGRSKTHCEAHRVHRNAQARKEAARHKERLGDVWLARHRAANRRQKYGAAANDLWNSTEGACSICAAPYRKRRIHIHHIDGNERNHSADNLVVLCFRCHRLIHALMAHPQAELTIAWFHERCTLPTEEPANRPTSGPFQKWEWRTTKEP